jgi:hypothetical protein
MKTLLTDIVVGKFCLGAKWWRKVNIVVTLTLEEFKKDQKRVDV